VPPRGHGLLTSADRQESLVVASETRLFPEQRMQTFTHVWQSSGMSFLRQTGPSGNTEVTDSDGDGMRRMPISDVGMSGMSESTTTDEEHDATHDDMLGPIEITGQCTRGHDVSLTFGVHNKQKVDIAKFRCWCDLCRKDGVVVRTLRHMKWPQGVEWKFEYYTEVCDELKIVTSKDKPMQPFDFEAEIPNVLVPVKKPVVGAGGRVFNSPAARRPDFEGGTITFTKVRPSQTDESTLMTWNEAMMLCGAALQ